MRILRGLKKISRKIPVNLFFLELIIILLFFSVSGAVILRMFAAADAEAIRSTASERAVLCAQSLSEIYAVKGDMRETADEYFGQNAYYTNVDNECAVTLDEDFRPLYSDDGRDEFGRVSLYLSETKNKGDHGTYSELNIRVFLLFNGEEEIYSHVCSAYIPDFAKEG